MRNWKRKVIHALFIQINKTETKADPEAQEPLYEEIHYTRKIAAGKKANDLSVFEVETVEHKLTGNDQFYSKKPFEFETAFTLL